MLRISGALIALWLLTPAGALAQEQRGSIEGLVKDTLGGVLPDVVVEARGTALVGVASTATDGRGAYRFPSLPPGRYELTATRESFSARVLRDVNLELGQVLKIEIVLQPAGVEATVRVHPESPLIDVKQNSAGGTISSETIDRIPKQRDYASLVTSVPGVDSEIRNRGIQIDGASGADNRFFIDGIDQTDLYLGTSLSTNSTGKALANDFVQEVQVKASGNGAEYRAAIGGVISAVTKSGSNQWHGSLGTYYLSNNLQGAVRPTLQLNPAHQDQAQYVLAPADAFTHWESAADVGGPIRPDRLWFHVGFDPQVRTTQRTVTFKSTNQPATFESKPADRVVNYTLTGQLTGTLRVRVAGSNERERGGAALPNVQTDGTSTSNPALFPSTKR